MQKQCANALRMLAADAVQQAKSGHPGMPMGMADIAEVLWRHHLHHDPTQPKWFNRDRFILSNGHGSMLLYGLLHLSGYDLSMEDLKQFRQLNSKTPGHPESHMTPGVEVTTGPLGQGIANAVGMAIAESQLAACFNQADFPIINHYTYAFCGDGCLMEGISHEACSLAGTLKLNKLILFWDNNGISIDGKTQGWFDEDVCKRFDAYGWHIQNIDGHDPQAIDQAIVAAKKSNKPSLIDCRTTIGYGAPNLSGSAKCHGAPLGDEEIRALREKLQWSSPAFVIPEAIQQAWDQREEGAKISAQWEDLWQAYQKKHPQLAATLKKRLEHKADASTSEDMESIAKQAQKETQPMATRKASLWCLNALSEHYPGLFGGSADLTESNLTRWQEATTFSATQRQGNYLYYGVREFAQFAIINGLNQHGGFHAFAGTFLTFVDYGRNALRLAAMMHTPSIFVFTHDSIGLGEDGPTHQPIEHLAMLRATPDLYVWRPCDLQETLVSWQMALKNTSPTCLILSRQSCPQQNPMNQVGTAKQGGYVLSRPQDKKADLLLIATGSEVALATEAQIQLAKDNIHAWVVSMPCMEQFMQQPQSYQQQILPHHCPRLMIEAGHRQSWFALKRDQDQVMGIDQYGVCAPGAQVFEAMGMTSESVKQKAFALYHARTTIAST